MRRILLLVIFGVLLFSCAQKDTENTMTVTGNIKGLKKGMLYLQKIPDSTLISIDSLRIDGDILKKKTTTILMTGLPFLGNRELLQSIPLGIPLILRPKSQAPLPMKN